MTLVPYEIEAQASPLSVAHQASDSLKALLSSDPENGSWMLMFADTF
jgi:hypothetical protein